MSLLYESFSKTWTKILAFFILRYEKLTKIYLSEKKIRNKLFEILSKSDDYHKINEIMLNLNLTM